jgi:hypothetical protein
MPIWYASLQHDELPTNAEKLERHLMRHAGGREMLPRSLFLFGDITAIVLPGIVSIPPGYNTSDVQTSASKRKSAHQGANDAQRAPQAHVMPPITFVLGHNIFAVPQ